MPVKNSLLIDLIRRLDPDLYEEFEERAGIIEFDANLSRAHAESLALLDVLRRHPSVLTGVTVLQFELDGGTQWLLTTDVSFARQHLADMGGVEISVRDLAEVIHEQYGGIAWLTTGG